MRSRFVTYRYSKMLRSSILFYTGMKFDSVAVAVVFICLRLTKQQDWMQGNLEEDMHSQHNISPSCNVDHPISPHPVWSSAASRKLAHLFPGGYPLSLWFFLSFSGSEWSSGPTSLEQLCHSSSIKERIGIGYTHCNSAPESWTHIEFTRKTHGWVM